jgi:hypothetical protein
LTNFLNGPKSVGDNFICHDNQLVSLEGLPESIGGFFYIKLGEIDKKYYHVIIPKIEELSYKGIKLYNQEEYYYPYKEAHYRNKLIELL